LHGTLRIILDRIALSGRKPAGIMLGAIVMKRDFLFPEQAGGESLSGSPITAFAATKQNYGLHVEVAGCVQLRPARNGAKNVIGIVELNDQVVPILDARQKRNPEISNLSCIVLFENVVGQTTIVTGRLYDSACQVFDMIVECMDAPDTHDRLYTPVEHHLISDVPD
jgi:hypothetical protein